MPYIYPKVADLKDKVKVGSHQCVALVQFYADAPHTSCWGEGAAVLGNKDILPGTAIATFVNGRYLSMPHGNHAALFVRHAVNGFWVMDQWIDRPDRAVRPISERFIPALKGKRQRSGSWPNASNNANAFSIIETR